MKLMAGEITVDEHGTEWREVASFFVAGLPAAGGNKTAIAITRNGKPVCGPNGRPIINVVEAKSAAGREKTKNWRAVVAHEAVIAMSGSQPLDEPLAIDVLFCMPRPKGHFGSGKHGNLIKASAPKFPTVRPDLLKIMRSTEDAMTGICYRDDALIVDEHLRREYGSRIGAQITLYALAEPVDFSPAPSPEPSAAKGGLF